MPIENRAAQFMPFAALTGYDDKISDAGKTFEENILKAEHPEEEFPEC
ncbi:MAG: hypothetical protein J6Q41_07230 [Firmicutes bacterium]|nr:hypothetical protein [Bacillota bacterium]